MDPLSLAFLLAPTIFKGAQGLLQGDEADKLRLRDTTPPAFKEALAMDRQASMATLPGAGAQLDRIGGGVNSTLAAGEQAGTSSQSILGLLEKADANRNQALTNLQTQQDAYTQQSARNLQSALMQQAGYQQHDQQELDRNRAALNESSKRNLYGAIDSGSQLAAYYLEHRNDPKTPAGTGGGSSFPFGPDASPYKPRRSRFGVSDISDFYNIG